MAAQRDYVLAFASPFARLVGDDPAAFGTMPAERARALLSALFRATSRDGTEAILEWFVKTGQRYDWSTYKTHAGTGAWKPNRRDTTVFRKAQYAIRHRGEMGEHALVAYDAARACAVAGWAVSAGFLSEAQAIRAVKGLVADALAKHASWKDFVHHAVLGLRFTQGEAGEELVPALKALEDTPLAWTHELPKASGAAKAERSKERPEAPSEPGVDAPPVILELSLSVDCRGCEQALSVRAIAPSETCPTCGLETRFDPSDWRYYFAKDAGERRKGHGEEDPFTNDFGDRFFSRRVMRRRDAVPCPCGAALPLEMITATRGELKCAYCGCAFGVREADELARAIDPKAVVVVEERPLSPTGSETYACAACGGTHPLGALADGGRVRECNAGKGRTFVADVDWWKAYGRPRRASMYLIARG
jgi:hypothetical protein